MIGRVGISIDFFNTLVEIDTDVPTIAQSLTSRGYPCSERIEAIWNSTGFDGQHTHDPHSDGYEEWRRRALGSLVTLCGAPDSETQQLVDSLLRLDQAWTVKARPGARDVLAWLRARQFAHCILTNWDYPIQPYLAMAGLPADVVALTSAELGVRKPLEAAFVEARRSMGVEPEHHIHVGDSWVADVVGAIRSGAWAIWVVEETPSDPLPRRILASSFADLRPTLEKLIAQIGLS